MQFKLPLPRMIPGMSWGTHKFIFLAWAYTAAGLTLWYSLHSQQKQKEFDDFVSYYRYSGHYKHPWQSKNQPYNDPRAIEVTKGIDYVKMTRKPQGSVGY